MSEFDPTRVGLPSHQDLINLRIWDLHFHGFDVMEAVLPYIRRMGIERLFCLDIGGWGDDPETRRQETLQRKKLERWRDLVFGIIRIDPTRPKASLEKMERWIADGPAVGIKYQGGYREDISCAHPNNDPIIERANELNAVIYIHTWLKVGGDPRHVGGGNNRGESTPMDVAKLAERFPDTPLICGHAGGDWELGVRAVRPRTNVFLEFAGSDPFSGSVDFAVKELGAERVVWGGHIESRSYSNELSKVFDADLMFKQRKQILGGNLRAIAHPILKTKGYRIEL